MIVISPSELRGNLKKYLDLAENERIIIQRGKTETFELRKRERISDDPYFDDIKNIEEIEKGIEDLRKGKYSKLDPTKTLWENIL
ncbi:type II toxin-antitoxin system Phd/YefM family antitoxin [Albibacterium bauzanense]|uniref:Antitoxin Phd_YefM of type II toxin-antitoxin system n=1 Tax=Albibacterium bauzanense TaxID=653929 RepID=A0A4R1M5V2_9SPHI|nr:type II toxin-antitoxin system Phd/YefM family antitoxin [Albibacterium bauzanense]TCK85089.1 antitoxin Phd_YefM of type II toxin-antitoxin system [Albibacterium bauzanense]